MATGAATHLIHRTWRSFLHRRAVAVAEITIAEAQTVRRAAAGRLNPRTPHLRAVATRHAYLLTSPRLGFRNWRDADRAPFAALCADPAVMRYFPAAKTRAESDATVDRLIAHAERHGYTFWAVDTLHDGAFIGFLGVIWQDGHDMPGCDLLPAHETGWRFRASAWGHGYATEGAQRCLRYAFSELAAPRVVAYTAVGNAASERVMQKVGMERVDTFAHPALAGHPLARHVLYEARPTDAASNR